MSETETETAAGAATTVPSFAEFASAMVPELSLEGFHAAYYRVLGAFAAGRLRRLIVTVPPQHGKSLGSSVLLPAYILGLDPTLAPKNPLYQGRYGGDQATRDSAYHQGTVWPWLLGPYIEANFRVYGKQFLTTAKELVAGFEEDMTSYGLCSIAEIYDGDPPHTPNGCISQAWSVAEILRSMKLIEQYTKIQNSKVKITSPKNRGKQ